MEGPRKSKARPLGRISSSVRTEPAWHKIGAGCRRASSAQTDGLDRTAIVLQTAQGALATERHPHQRPLALMGGVRVSVAALRNWEAGRRHARQWNVASAEATSVKISHPPGRQTFRAGIRDPVQGFAGSKSLRGATDSKGSSSAAWRCWIISRRLRPCCRHPT